MVKTVREALELAQEKEQHAYDFYVKLLDHVKDLGTKALIKELADEEIEHKKIVGQVIESGDVGTLVLNKECYIEDLGISKMTIPKVISQDLQVQDVLRIAIKHEENSRIFYGRLAEQFKGEELETIFHRLAHEEECHRNNFQKMYDDIVMQEN